MIRMRGRGTGAGLALGSASVLRSPQGIPLLPAHMVARLAKVSRDTPIEPMEVIVVAADYESAVSLAVPWARVVGIVAEAECLQDPAPGVPTVTGVPGLLNNVTDEALILVDADNGVVLVDPDAMALAVYQAERERLAPKRRIYLGFEHLPARTLDGREVRVLARVETLDDVRAAVEAGADAIYAPAGAALAPADVDDDEQFEAVMEAASEAAGKPLTLAGDARTLAVSAMLRAALRVDLTVAMPLAAGVQGFNELREHSREVREELIERELTYGEFRLAGVTALGEDPPADLADLGVTRAVIDPCGDADLSDVAHQAWLDDLASAAAALWLPVEMCLPDTTEASVATAVGLGVVGLIVPPHQVQAAKEQVRLLDASECRAALVRRSA